MKKTTKRRGRGEGACFESAAKGCWIGRVKVRGKLLERSAPTKKALLAKLEAAAPAPAGGALTVADYLDRWLPACSRLEPSTRSAYADVIRAQIKPRLGRVRLSQLRRDGVKAAWADMTADGLGASYVRKAHAVLSSALSDALEDRLIEANPAARMRLPKLPDEPVDVLSPAEGRAIVAAAAGHPHGAFAVLLLLTGLRLAEALALRWPDVDLDRAALTVSKALWRKDGAGWQTKGPKTARGRRTIDLPQLLVGRLREHKAERQPDAALPLFCTRKGAPPHAAVAERQWAAVLRAAGVRARPPHVARHSHASALLEAGVSLTAVAARLGDSPATVARVYSHWLRQDGRMGAVVQQIYAP